jgi:hypothetical protein
MDTQSSGLEALKHVQPRLDALQTLPAKRLGIDAETLAPTLQTRLSAINQDKDEILAVFAPHVQTTLSAWIEEMPWLVRAWLHVSSDYDRTPQAISPRSALGQEAYSLRPAVMHSLDLMEKIDLISSLEAKQIREGRGFDDLGGDFRTMGAKLQAAWPILGPIQKLHKDTNLHLDEAKIQRVIELGTLIGETEKTAKDPKSPAYILEKKLLAIESLLDEGWSYLRAMLPAAYTAAGRPKKSEVVGQTLRGLQRTLTPSTAPNSNKPPTASETPPTDTPSLPPATPPTPETPPQS